MLTGPALRTPLAFDSAVSTSQWTLLPSVPLVLPLSVDWYEPAEPALANFPAFGLPDGTARDRSRTPFPNESICPVAPRMLDRRRSSSMIGHCADTRPSRVVGLRTPNRPTQMFGAEAPMTPFRSDARTFGKVMVVVAFTNCVRLPRFTM